MVDERAPGPGAIEPGAIDPGSAGPGAIDPGAIDPGAVVVLDGGLATELESRGHDLSGVLWSARVLADEPGAIEAVHDAYFEAGARVATTASYQATLPGFAAAGIAPDAGLALIRSSVEIARRARDRATDRARAGGDDRPRFVVGSVGPYGAMLADGSEYTGAYSLTEAQLRDFHRPRLEALLEAGADLLAFETIPSMIEGEALVRLLDEYTGARAWLSYQCRDGQRTARGEPFEEAVAVALGHPGVVGVGVNCTAPGDVPPLLERVADVGIPLVAYPNRGRDWDATSRTWRSAGGSVFDAAATARWTDLGVRWVGGCCGVGPVDIAALAERLAA
jgi:homocysteine S-methyltransferase